MSPSKIDAVLRALKHFGPYGNFIAFGFLGLAIFIFGGRTIAAAKELDPAGQSMRWIGVGFCFFSLVCACLWHFFEWPPRMAGPSAPTKAAAKSRATMH